jgi:type VI protein secretion system component VasF
MTLLELTEPLFQYICRINRVARKTGGGQSGHSGETALLTRGGDLPRGMILDYSVVRNEIKGLFDDLAQKAEKDFKLKEQFRKVRLPLIFFVDSMISESPLALAQQWNQDRMAFNENELAGDERFFDLLDGQEGLKDQSEEGNERLAVFYTCMGLGFSGFYFGQPDVLRAKMLTIAPRIKRYIEVDDTAKICPDAYEGVDTRKLNEPPSKKVLIVSLIFICLIVAAVGSFIWLYFDARTTLTASFKEIAKHAPK